jgi:hypothetical protein
MAARTDVERPAAPAPLRNETPTQRIDRNFSELLQELRVAQTGIQILLAFLLTMAFSNRFLVVHGAAMALYVTAVLISALAVCLLIGPVAVHRLLFRRGEKAELVETAHVLTIAGLAALAVAVVCAITLVVQVALGWWPALGAAAALVVLFTVVWVLLPLHVRRAAARRPPEPS